MYEPDAGRRRARPRGSTSPAPVRVNASRCVAARRRRLRRAQRAAACVAASTLRRARLPEHERRRRARPVAGRAGAYSCSPGRERDPVDVDRVVPVVERRARPCACLPQSVPRLRAGVVVRLDASGAAAAPSRAPRSRARRRAGPSRVSESRPTGQCGQPVDAFTSSARVLEERTRPGRLVSVGSTREEQRRGGGDLRRRERRALRVAVVVRAAVGVALVGAASGRRAVSARGKVEKMPTPGAAMSLKTASRFEKSGTVPFCGSAR